MSGPGELIVGGDELSFSEPPSPEPGGTWEQRELQVKGREELVRAWTLRLSVTAP